MPVGTQATVKALAPSELSAAGAQILLSNTYHLHLRPGESVIAELGGLHQFMGWDGPILTDSGGFQVFSLGARPGVGARDGGAARRGGSVDARGPSHAGLVRITGDGVEFTSHIDGSRRTLTPESSIDIQAILGSDVAMAFDQCSPGDQDRATAQSALDRTLSWLARCVAQWERNGRVSRQGYPQALFGIVQGGFFRDLRERAARAVVDWDLLGVAIGGESIGYSKEQTATILGWIAPLLPEARLRYAMGIGDPAGFFTVIERGIDVFDSVLPTRLGRHGACFTRDGRIDLLRAVFVDDPSPIDPGCECAACAQFSRAYVRHLLRAGEQLGARLASLHNVWFCSRLTREIRSAILEDRYVDFRDAILPRLRGPFPTRR